MWMACSTHAWPPHHEPLEVMKLVCWPIHVHTNPWGRFKRPSAITGWQPNLHTKKPPVWSFIMLNVLSETRCQWTTQNSNSVAVNTDHNPCSVAWTKSTTVDFNYISLDKKATMHQVTTMLATSKTVLFPGHNHLLTTGTDNPSL